MIDYIEYKLKKIFPNADIKVQQDFGIITIYIKIGNYFLCEYKTSVRKNERIIIKETFNYFIDRLFRFMINENELDIESEV